MSIQMPAEQAFVSPKFAIGERVFVPSAHQATKVIEVVPLGDSFRYRLAGLGQALIAEAEMEQIAIDGRHKPPVISPRDRLKFEDAADFEASCPPTKVR
jgi:hypothetical protein